jgi:hypothetical protein
MSARPLSQMGIEVKLYRSTKDVRWLALGPKIGWVTFPAEVGGWEKRQPPSGKDRKEMREVPLRMGFNTGIPGAPLSADSSSNLQFSEKRPIARHNRQKAKIICLTCNLKGCVGRCRFQSVELLKPT